MGPAREGLAEQWGYAGQKRACLLLCPTEWVKLRGPGRGRCAPRRQSLLRSCLAPHSFPRRPPAWGVLYRDSNGLPDRTVRQYVARRRAADRAVILSEGSSDAEFAPRANRDRRACG